MTVENLSMVPPAPTLSGSVTVSTYGASIELPALVGDAGENAAHASFEFFTARVPNANTRDAYARAVRRFCAWASAGGVTLSGLTAVHVAAYLQALEADGLSAGSVKQHFAGIRHWLDYLTQKGVLPFNPALSVRGPRLTSNEGKTPVLERSEVKELFAAFDTELEEIRKAEEKAAEETPPSSPAQAMRRQREQERRDAQRVIILRDKAMLSVMLYNVPRVSAVCALRVRDYDDTGDGWLLLHEKRGKERRLPAHHKVREAVRDYVAAAGLEARSTAPLFQTAPARSRKLSGLPMHRSDAWSMVKRRCADAGLSESICTHSFRATGLTIHHENGGTLQAAAELAGHESTRTTQRYVRTTQKAVRTEVERINP